MNSEKSLFQSCGIKSIIRFLRCAISAVACYAVVVLPTAVIAQETTSGIRGQISSSTSVEGVTITVTDTRTDSQRRVDLTDTGIFFVGGLRVGGPYTLDVSSPSHRNQRITGVELKLGETVKLDILLEPDESGASDELEEIVVVASQQAGVSQLALGPSSVFDFSTLQAAPAINRDIKDVIRLDPRVYVNETFADGLQCAGANPRFNSLTVDGVRMNDNFGLNNSGYPTERIPFSFDSLEQVSVELAPFDVRYGGFTACNINAVTRSGGNEFHGSAFYDYTNESLSGDRLEGDNIDLGKFDEERFGFAIGGPIVSDRLFFFTSYEKLNGQNTFDRGPSGTSVGSPVNGVSIAQAERIADISRNIYGYDPGAFETSLPVKDEKFLAKLDWEIDDRHRASLTYNYNDGFNIRESDSSSTRLEFSNHRYERGAKLESVATHLFSNWSDSFSTEMRIALASLDNRQIPRGGTDFGEVQIETFNDHDNDGVFSNAIVYLGADDSRQANKLSYDTVSYKLSATQRIVEHELTFGFEREEFDVSNLFIQEAEGEFVFDDNGGLNCGPANPDGCIDAFEAGTPRRVIYENAAPTNVATDAAARFAYEVNTLYLQDAFSIYDNKFNIVAGLRYDWYTSDDAPAENSNFIARYGFSNSTNLDGEGLLQPRLGFSWDVHDRLLVRGGAGLYSGGNPNVWLSNNYSNNGFTQVEVSLFGLDSINPCQLPCSPSLFTVPTSGDGRPIWNIPQSLVDAVASGSADSGVNALSDDFKIPSQWKFNLGATWDFDLGRFGSEYTLNADIIHTQSKDSATIINATLAEIGVAADGRPIYRRVDFADPDCAIDPANCAFRGQQDYILTNINGSDSNSTSYSVSIAKAHDWGMSWAFSYAHIDSEDVNPMTSSTASSNFNNLATSDPNRPGLSRSNYEIPNRFTLRLDFKKELFGDNLSKFVLYGSVNEGRPYSYVFNTSRAFGDSAFTRRHLLYVPTGPNDPNVVFGPSFDQAAFFDFVQSSGLSRYAGRVAPRNAFHSSWWTKFDLRFEQELPGFLEDSNFALFLLVENIGNLLNDDWGVLKDVAFPRTQTSVNVGVDPNTGQLLFNGFSEPSGGSRSTEASLWEIRLGLRFEF